MVETKKGALWAPSEPMLLLEVIDEEVIEKWY